MFETVNAGETANGKFPTKAVATMAAIVANAEVGVNYYQASNRNIHCQHVCTHATQSSHETWAVVAVPVSAASRHAMPPTATGQHRTFHAMQRKVRGCTSLYTRPSVLVLPADV